MADVDVPVCIIGCGPIGLAGALPLSRHGVPSVVVERWGELNRHPRSRSSTPTRWNSPASFAVGVAITDHMGPMMIGHRTGADIVGHRERTRLYDNCDHVLLGFELSSDLIAPESDPPPPRSPFEPPSPIAAMRWW